MSNPLHAFLIEQFNEAPLNKTLGVTLEYNAQGEAVCRWKRKAEFDHGGQDTHGGILMTLLDMAGWFTAAAQSGAIVVTSDLNVRLLSPAKQQDLVATARVIRDGSKAVIAEMTVSSPKGLVATANASFAKIGEFPKG
ncbi:MULTISPECIES: PaaI family thioesterase [Corallococcus]|uniref:PaaI family thioesterase n=1 Tax=Corallococcus TaxID=83461 RepID=UPI00117D7926|nr:MULTISPECIES: PaaI family thioesterase [Corallococcus]NBD10816.1 hotdog fold thioesterase [Corallococcus silvisoli]TSC31740.1 PaaI family thioesterase [Corallococcus sp. Z5C101001]